MEFIIKDKDHELRGAIIGNKRWVVGSTVGRAVGLNSPKSFAKTLIKKPPLLAWPDSFVADGFGIDRNQALYAIERRVLSSSLCAYVVAHMRVDEESVSVFRFLLKLHEHDYDKTDSELPLNEFSLNIQTVGIEIEP